jgi:hypothetical protein
VEGADRHDGEAGAGRHTLQLPFADGAHRSYGEAMRATITVAVK